MFTRREVVEFILDLIGYTVDAPLHHLQLLEPSYGRGDFLLPAVQRLLESCWKHSHNNTRDVSDLLPCIRAVELHAESFNETRHALLSLLVHHGISDDDAESLVACWLIKGDFLLTDFSCAFTHVIGNPPYIRQEMIPALLLSEYRSRFETMYGRADI